MMRLVLVAFLCGLVTACNHSTFLVPEREAVSLRLVSFDDLPDWSQDSLSAAVPAFLRSCWVFLRQPKANNVSNGQLTAGIIADWHGPCRAAEYLPPGDNEAARHFFESWFEPLRVVQTKGEKDDGLFTGYYEVELAGSLTPTGPYRTPLLGKPSDLITVDLGQFRRPELKNEVLVGRVEGSRLRPYLDRAHIEMVMATAKVKPNPNMPVIAWVRDPIEAFLLHIQGSGLVRLDDGTSFRVGYTADNGHKFVSIAQRLIERGWVTHNQASMNAVRDWLRDHPDQARTVMAENPRFIFFRVIDTDGPVGAQGVPLTAGRSLAIDPRYLPLGVPLWLDTHTPNGQSLRRLVIAQDTGSAITGPVRGDFFWGHGEVALAKAGRMKSKGCYYILLPRFRSSPMTWSRG